MKDLVDNLNPYVSRVILNVRPLQHPDSGHKIRHSFSPMQEELRLLVEQWQSSGKSGPNLRELLSQRPDLQHRCAKRLMTLWPTSSGRGHLEWQGLETYDPAERAFELFFELISNPLWETLGGPCARCGRYYLKNTKRQKVYCSRTCGSGATARSAVQKKRIEEHKQKLRWARSEIKSWRSRKRRIGWKRWISQRNPDLTVQWLTRAHNRGELSAPNG